MSALALMRAVADFRLRDALDEDCGDYSYEYDTFGSCGDSFRDEIADGLGEFWLTSLFLLLLGFLCTIPVFLVWFHRVRTNAEALAPGRHRHVPGMALSAWFLPFANWWIPKQIADDILMATAPPPPAPPYGIPPKPRGAGLLLGWWSTWVGSSVLSAVGWWLLVSPDEADDARFGLLVLALGDLALVAAGVLGVLTVRMISDAQDIGMGFRAALLGPHPAPAFGGPARASRIPHPAGPFHGAPAYGGGTTSPAPAYGGAPPPVPVPPPASAASGTGAGSAPAHIPGTHVSGAGSAPGAATSPAPPAPSGHPSPASPAATTPTTSPGSPATSADGPPADAPSDAAPADTPVETPADTTPPGAASDRPHEPGSPDPESRPDLEK
ncbi:DUF4328 domain-containing protein [Streptomyces pactum]|uniref:DUF4328 domain-containing protein n=1 Tax=Streptomyces pactum TaxID=68249 RepID=UPI0036F931D7